MPVAELEARMPMSELSEWVEFFNLEPWGWEADCFKAGIVAATVANVHRDSKKKKTPFEAVDFIPGFQKQPRKTDPKLLKAQLQLAFAGARWRATNNVHDQRGQGAGKPPEAARPRRGPPGNEQRAPGGSEADHGRSKEAGPISQEKEAKKGD